MSRSKQKGFTLLEVVVVVVVTSILVAGTVKTYANYLKLHKREQVVTKIEMELGNIEQTMQATLTSLPGRDLGFLASSYHVATLPNLATDNKGIPLGTITPFKINGFDAFMVLTTGKNSPRLELAQSFNINSSVARVALPDRTPGNFNANNDNPVSPNQFNPGDYLLISGTPDGSFDRAFTPKARIIKLLRTPTFGQLLATSQFRSNQFSQDTLDFNVDSCSGSACQPFSNDGSYTSFTLGSTLMPLITVCYYIKGISGQNYLVRNEGGIIVLNNGNSVVSGGTETLVAELDNFSVCYTLDDTSVQPTPISPNVNWLQHINSINISVSRNIPSPIGKEILERQKTTSFPIINFQLQ